MYELLKTLNMPKGADSVTYEIHQVKIGDIPINNVYYAIEKAYKRGCTTPYAITNYCNECIGNCTTIMKN